jgi:hypothetical protein
MSRYSSSDFNGNMKPQARRDKVIIDKCIDGLGLFAAQKANADRLSPEIGKIRSLVETLVQFWGLSDSDYYANARSPDDYLQSFNEGIREAITGVVSDDVSAAAPNAIDGLYLYGMEMVACQGKDAMSDILDVSDLMKEISTMWSIKADALTDRLENEVQDMLDNYPMHGHKMSGMFNIGYEIIQGVMFDNGMGIVLAHNPYAPSPFVTWRFGIDDEGGMWYELGNYFSSELRATIDHIERCDYYVDNFNVREVPFPADAGAEIYDLVDGDQIDVRETTPDPDIFDPSVSQTDMHAYGYEWDGMIPLRRERALEFFDKGYEVFRLYEDDAEGAAECRADIESFEGLFGIELPVLVRSANERSIQVLIPRRERNDRGAASDIRSDRRARRQDDNRKNANPSVLRQLRDAKPSPKPPRKEKRLERNNDKGGAKR